MYNLSSRTRLNVAHVGSTLVLLGATGLARAQAPTTTVALAASTCPPEVIDVDALAAALRTELLSTLGAVATVTRGSTEGAAYRIDLACPSRDTIDVTLTSAAPRDVELDRISVADVEPAARPRAVALAVAERMRALRSAPAEPVPTPPAAMPSLAPPPRPPAPPSDARARRLRLASALAIGFGALTVACAVIGGPLVTVGNRDPPNNRRGLVIAGETLLGIGGAALIVTGVSFGLWLHERHR
jgi:hypothetical protein